MKINHNCSGAKFKNRGEGLPERLQEYELYPLTYCFFMLPLKTGFFAALKDDSLSVKSLLKSQASSSSFCSLNLILIT